MKSDKTIYFFVLVFAFLVLGGFYLIFDKISGLETEVKNVELNYQLASKNSTAETPTISVTSTPETAGNPPVQNPSAESASTDITIPTGIIFTASSSPTLQPQTPVTITIESVIKKSDGSIVVQMKTFTSQATSYSAIDPKTFIQYVSLDSENQDPANASPIFASMPPKSVNTGTVIFYANPDKTVIILQMGRGDNPTFYEFNFTKKTYRETVVG
ncbi:MAG: hypothetical protein AAB399_00565 [Patescibacteria group bacterium]